MARRFRRRELRALEGPCVRRGGRQIPPAELGVCLSLLFSLRGSCKNPPPCHLERSMPTSDAIGMGSRDPTPRLPSSNVAGSSATEAAHPSRFSKGGSTNLNVGPAGRVYLHCVKYTLWVPQEKRRGNEIEG